MNARPPIHLLALAIAAFAAVPSTARADDKKANFDVAILAIRATSANSDISPELKPVAEQLRKKYKFTGYKVERQATAKTAANQEVSKPLPADYTAKVTPMDGDAKSVDLKVEIWRKVNGKDELRVNTKIKAERGKYSFLGGWKFDGGDDVMIIAISAK